AERGQTQRVFLSGQIEAAEPSFRTSRRSGSERAAEPAASGERGRKFRAEGSSHHVGIGFAKASGSAAVESLALSRMKTASSLPSSSSSLLKRATGLDSATPSALDSAQLGRNFKRAPGVCSIQPSFTGARSGPSRPYRSGT